MEPGDGWRLGAEPVSKGTGSVASHLFLLLLIRETDFQAAKGGTNLVKGVSRGQERTKSL